MFKVLSHTADVGIEVSAESLTALFIEAARGWKYCVIEDSPTQPLEDRKIHLTAPNLEDLLVQWLNELNFYLTVDQWILHEVTGCDIEFVDSEWSGDFLISGEPLDFRRHEICIDIKSVTYHQLEVRKLNGHYKTRIIFDI